MLSEKVPGRIDIVELVVTWKKLVVAVVLIAAGTAGYYRFYRGVPSMGTKELFEEYVEWNPVAKYHLKKRKAEHAVAAVAEYLTHEKADVRVLAAELLGRPKDAEAVGALRGSVGDASPKVRAAVARSLVETNVDREVVPLLVWMLDDKDAAVQTAVTRGLRAVTGASGIHGVEGWKTWWDMHRTEY